MRVRLLMTMIPLLAVSALAFGAEVKYDSGSRRDPMIPLVTADGGVNLAGGAGRSAGDFKVEGIIFDPKEGSYALINGKFYKQGEQVDQAQLVSILKDRVVLSVNDSEKTVWLREETAEGAPLKK